MKGLKDKEVFLAIALFVEFIFMYRAMTSFWLVFIAMLITIIFGTVSILGVKFSLKNIMKNIHFFILPLSYFLGAIYFLSIVETRFIQYPLIIAFTVTNIPLYKGLKKLSTSRGKPLVISRNMISMISLITIFLLLTDIINATIFYKLPVYVMMALGFASVWLVTYFLYWQYRDIEKDSFIYINVISLILMEILWAGSFWITSYPSFELGGLGVPVFAIIGLVTFYSFWGIAHHKLEDNLTKKVLLEYIMISGIIIAIILFTTNWIPEGIV